MVSLGCSLLFCGHRDSIAQVTGEAPRTSLPTSGDGGDLGGGQLNFQPDLFTGRFTYSVPIVVPPGRQNSQPKIKLLYNSSDGNGWCGVGWQLELGKIERETRYGVPILWTNGARAQYDDSKSFTVNFAGTQGHLVKVSPAGQTPLEYRLSVDKSFLKFLFYNQISNAYWSVLDKGGNQYFFGEAATNRLDNPNFRGGFGTNTFRWALDRIRDPNGNESYVSYTNDHGQLYPVRVSYNANVNTPALNATHTIDFVLTNRSDQSLSFKSGFRTETRDLLSQIIIKADGQKARRYVLAYTNSPSTLRSLLASVAQYGTDDTNSLPPVVFAYQVKPFGFGPLQDWSGLNSQGLTNADWNSLQASDTNGNSYVRFIDIDGDGLPDRVMRSSSSPYNTFIVQRNTGSGFTGNYTWGGLDNQGQTTAVWGSLTVSSNQASGTNLTSVDFFDVNGDGKPDRVMTNFQSGTSWRVQLNSGTPSTNSFSIASLWGTLQGAQDDVHSETGSLGGYDWALEEMVDLNGDGLVDRLLSGQSQAQLNTGSGFGPIVNFTNIISTFYVIGNAGQSASPSYLGTDFYGKSSLTSLQDINGDGLPDVIQPSPPGGGYGWSYSINFNNGWEAELVTLGTLGVSYAPILSEGFTNQSPNTDYGWNQPYYWVDESGGTGNMVQMVDLIDINGDGLPDRVLTKAYSPFDRFKVQLNTGSGFGPLIDWTNVLSEAGNTSQPWNAVSYVTNGQMAVSLVDIDGDGLPDRVMRKLGSPYGSFKVQLNQGPFPDLLSEVDNGIGGKVMVAYTPSTKYDNTDRTWTNDPWAEGAKSLLPFPVYTVSTIRVDDGFGNQSTNTYAYKHGMFDPVSREFRGFNSVIVTDPFGAKTVTYFHQSGGFDDSTNGEFLDQGSFSKKGMPYRVEAWGTNGLLYQLTLNKVIENILSTNGWYFPCITQTIVMSYEGLTSYRAIAKQFTYDTNTENLTAEADYGEVTNVVANGQAFTDIANDSLFEWMTYTNIGTILDRPSDAKITSDSAGANRLRETLFAYDGNGNLTLKQLWLDTAGNFITISSALYDQYGNLSHSTDAAGITTTNVFDSTYYQYPVTQNTATFSSQATYDIRSGKALTATDAKGLVSSNAFDVFFRSTGSYISTNAYGTPNLWRTRTYYSQGGISNGISLNYFHSQINDGVDPVNGYETYKFADGLGRPIETRSESETGQFRVANSSYDRRGKVFYQTLPYFSSGTNYTVLNGSYLGALTEYDAIGRGFRETPAVQAVFNSSGQLQSTTATGGDTGSPVGPATLAFVDGGNPWATVATDSEGKVKKSYHDAYGRSISVTEVTSNANVNTTYVYDLIGNLTNLADNAGNVTRMGYDSLGRKTSMTDPDMGAWTYSYDNADRLTQQVDARTNTIKLFYSDQLGRLSSKQISNSSNSLVGTVTYTYDTSDDTNYTVFKGQLYKVIDLQGYQRSSYDVRGRVLKTGRFLNLNAMEYLTQATYDDADRLQQLTYPGNAATVQYSYDTAGHLNQVKSIAGTGANETFYTPGGFNALGLLTSYTNGNGVISAYAYYGNSARLRNVTTGTATTNYQNLTYTYDTVSDVKSINDGIYSGAASAALNNIVYDDLYRLVSLNSTARGVKNYAYDTLGNIVTNQDFGSGQYQYGTKPHAVISANGTSYGYDAGGNMVTRGNQTLGYDEQNQLSRVATTNDLVTFGYDESGERLWRSGTNGYTIWIGGIYEVNGRKVLCHVLAGGQLLATFEPQCTAGLSKILGDRRWYAASVGIRSLLDWPFQKGRGPWTVFGGTWMGIVAVCFAARRGVRLRRHEFRAALRPRALCRQAVTFTVISAFVAGSAQNVEAATYNPVFYYYHPDRLGSANLMTDRSGNLVQHYEYTSFGQTSYSGTTSAFPISNRYTEQIADDETGLYYYGGRYYDPQLGRFVQPDPTVPDPEDSQSLNRYSYVRNNPLNAADPSGLDDSGGGDFGGSDFWGGDWFGAGWGNNNNPSANNSSQWSFNFNITYDFAIAQFTLLGRLDPGGAEFSAQLSYVQSLFYDDRLISEPVTAELFNFSTSWSSLPAPNPSQVTDPSPAPAPTPSGGGLLSSVANVAGWLSLIPGPVGTVAGIVNGVGEALQGHWGAAAIGLGGAALATVGLGFVAKIGKEAREAEKIAQEAIRIRHYTNAKGLQGIAEKSIITASDQNRVFAESARLKPLSQLEAESTYGLKPGRGRNYVETDVAKSSVRQRYNPKTGANELVIRGDVPLQNPTFTKRP